MGAILKKGQKDLSMSNGIAHLWKLGKTPRKNGIVLDAYGDQAPSARGKYGWYSVLWM